MNNYKKILIALSIVIILLVIGISYEINYNKKIKTQDNKMPVKEILVHKKEDNKEIEGLLEDESEKEKDEVQPTQDSNFKPEEEQIITIPAEPVIKENQEPIKEQDIVVEPEKETPKDEIKRKNDILGTAGRLYIPSVNISVGLNTANIYGDANYNAQDIVNQEDSAAYYYFGSKLTIADHDYQGFNKINNLNLDDRAYIKKNNGQVEEYQMINKFAGRNIGTDLIDIYNNSVQNMNGTLIMYTCYGAGDSIMITLWNQVA